MPLYEYDCGKCGVFELVRKFADPPLVKCPTCGGELTKLVSAPAIQFKGSGWYITDYARKGSGKESSNKEPSGKESKGEGAEKSDKKGEGAASTPTAKDSAPSTPAAATSDTGSKK